MKIKLLLVLFCICILFTSCNNVAKNESSNLSSNLSSNISSLAISSTVLSSNITNSSNSKEIEKLIYDAKDKYYSNKYSQAIDICDKVLAIDSNSYEAYTVKGISLCRLRNLTEGFKLIDKALEIKNDYTYGRFSKAMAYKIKGDKDKCLEWFYKALETDPNDVWSIYGAATIYADRYDIDNALDMLERSIKLEPSIKKLAKEQYGLHWEKFRYNERFIKLVN